MFEELAKEQLLDLAERYSSASTVSLSAIGKLALNDNTFFSRVKAGATFTVRTFDRLVAWFSENWPEGAEWPAGVARPVVQTESAQ